MDKSDLQKMMTFLWALSQNSSVYSTIVGISDPKATKPAGLIDAAPQSDEGIAKFGWLVKETSEGRPFEDWESLPNSPRMLCEFVIAVIALHSAGAPAEETDKLALSAVSRLLSNQASTIGADGQGDLNLRNGQLIRELSHLLAMYYEETKNFNNQRLLLRHRVNTTLKVASNRPDLVTAACMQHTNALNGETKTKDKLNNYVLIANDSEYLIERIDDEALPVAEKSIALNWLAEAYRGQANTAQALGALPGPVNEATAKFETLTQMLTERGWNGLFTLPRYGWITSEYQNEAGFVAHILSDLQKNSSNGDRTAIIREVCHRFGVTTIQVERYLEAWQSYGPQRSLPPGQRQISNREEALAFQALDMLRAAE